MKNKGFTLVELLIAVSLIAVLSGVLFSIINPLGIQRKTRDSQRIADLAKVKVALENYYADHRSYPTNSGVNTWAHIVNPPNPDLASELVDAYINVMPLDPSSTGTYCDAEGWRGYFYKTNAAGTYYILLANLEVPPEDLVCPYTLANQNLDCGGCNVGYYATAD